jgi:hypothetical protein
VEGSCLDSAVIQKRARVPGSTFFALSCIWAGLAIWLTAQHLRSCASTMWSRLLVEKNNMVVSLGYWVMVVVLVFGL